MSYLLSATQIKAPDNMTENNSTQIAQQRTLQGAVTRDLFGTNKRVWTLNYKNCKKSFYDIMNAIYKAYLSTNATVTFQVTDASYTISSTLVHVDLLTRSFGVQGSDYISDFTLTLTEA